jgi:hypothetical protein
VLHHGSGLSWEQAGVRYQVANVDCCADELEPSRFGLAVESSGEGAVERFEFGQVCSDTVVDGLSKVLVGKRAEIRKSSADNIYVVVVIGAGAHVAKSPDVIDWVFAVCRVVKVRFGKHSNSVTEVYMQQGREIC